MSSFPAAAGPDLATFADSLERSRLVAGPNVAGLLAGQGSAAAAADRLVSAGVLTRYQADKLLDGRWQGLVLGAYRILHPIGRGGMGIVYLAAKEGESKRLALKVLPPKRAGAEPRRLARFKREMRIGRIVPPHANVVATVDTGVVDGVHFLAMEYAPGATLKQRVAKLGPLPPETAVALFARAAAGLAAVHSVGVVHRDVSPGNLILTPSGGIKLLDFGVAMVAGEPLPADPSVAGGAGYTMGTMDYIAPEQVRDATAATFASDVYALGCSLYFALAGTPPYPGGDSRQKVRWHERSAAPAVMSLNPLVPAALSDFVERMMAKAPADRPASAVEVERELLAFAPAEESLPPVEHSMENWPGGPVAGGDGFGDLPAAPTSNGIVWAAIGVLAAILAGMILLLTVLVMQRR